MRVMTAAFEAAKNKTSAKPVWLVEVETGVTTLFWSDRTINDGVNNYDDRVISVGEINSVNDRISGGTLKSSMTLSVSELPSSVSFALRVGNLVRVYLWFDGEGLTSADRLLMFFGIVSDPINASVDKISVTINSLMEKHNSTVGELLTQVEYAGADPGDIGKTKPIIYGSVKGHKCLAIDAGGLSKLSVDLPVEYLHIDLSDASFFPLSGTVTVNNEEMTYTGKDGDRLTSVTRGVNGTVAAVHLAGSDVGEIKIQYDYLVADHPVTSIDAVYVDGVKQVNYTVLLDDGGQAKIRFNTLPTLKRQVNVGINDGITVTDNIGVTSNAKIKKTDYASVGIPVLLDDSAVTHTISFVRRSDASDSYVEVGITDPWRVLGYWSVGQTVKLQMRFLNASGAAVSGWFTVWSVQCVSGACTSELELPRGGSLAAYIEAGDVDRFEIKWVPDAGAPELGTYITAALMTRQTPSTTTKSGNAYRSGSVALSGDSTADIVIGGKVTVDVTGYNLTYPHNVIEHLLLNYSNGMSAANIDSSISTGIGHFPDYQLGFVLFKQYDLMTLCRQIAHQARSRFFYESGKAYIAWMYSTVPATSDKAINKSTVSFNSLSMAWTKHDQIMNKITSVFDYRQQTKEYEQAYFADDLSSQTSYGVRDGSRFFKLNLVEKSLTATNVIGAYLTRFKNPKRVFNFSSPLVNIEIQRGDSVDLTHDIDGGISGIKCEIMQTTVDPGSGKENRPDSINFVCEEI